MFLRGLMAKNRKLSNVQCDCGSAHMCSGCGKCYYHRHWAFFAWSRQDDSTRWFWRGPCGMKLALPDEGG